MRFAPYNPLLFLLIPTPQIAPRPGLHSLSHNGSLSLSGEIPYLSVNRHETPPYLLPPLPPSDGKRRRAREAGVEEATVSPFDGLSVAELEVKWAEADAKANNTATDLESAKKKLTEKQDEVKSAEGALAEKNAALPDLRATANALKKSWKDGVDKAEAFLDEYTELEEAVTRTEKARVKAEDDLNTALTELAGRMEVPATSVAPEKIREWSDKLFIDFPSKEILEASINTLKSSIKAVGGLKEVMEEAEKAYNTAAPTAKTNDLKPCTDTPLATDSQCVGLLDLKNAKDKAKADFDNAKLKAKHLDALNDEYDNVSNLIADVATKTSAATTAAGKLAEKAPEKPKADADAAAPMPPDAHAADQAVYTAIGDIATAKAVKDQLEAELKPLEDDVKTAQEAHDKARSEADSLKQVYDVAKRKADNDSSKGIATGSMVLITVGILGFLLVAVSVGLFVPRKPRQWVLSKFRKEKPAPGRKPEASSVSKPDAASVKPAESAESVVAPSLADSRLSVTETAATARSSTSNSSIAATANKKQQQPASGKREATVKSEKSVRKVKTMRFVDLPDNVHKKWKREIKEKMEPRTLIKVIYVDGKLKRLEYIHKSCGIGQVFVPSDNSRRVMRTTDMNLHKAPKWNTQTLARLCTQLFKRLTLDVDAPPEKINFDQVEIDPKLFKAVKMAYDNIERSAGGTDDNRSKKQKQKSKGKMEKKLKKEERKKQRRSEKEDKDRTPTEVDEQGGTSRGEDCSESKEQKLLRILEAVLTENITEEFPFKYEDILDMLTDAKRSLMEEESMVECGLETYVFGDFHGDFLALLTYLCFLSKNGKPVFMTHRLVFNGDYVDRGKQSHRTIFALLALKILFPKNVILLRGNHETREINRTYGFRDDLLLLHGKENGTTLWQWYNEVFSYLPYTCLIGDKILTMHGGVPRDPGATRDVLRKLPRPYNDTAALARLTRAGQMIIDLIWSDPAFGSFGSWVKNKARGMGIHYSQSHLERVMASLGVVFIIRAHQEMENGYKFFCDAKQCTVFSAPAYNKDSVDKNRGAALYIDKRGHLGIITVVPEGGAMPDEQFHEQSNNTELGHAVLDNEGAAPQEPAEDNDKSVTRIEEK